MCLEAVKQTGGALQYIKNPTEEMCLEAVKQTGHALSMIKEPTEEMCLEAVKQTGGALSMIKEPTEEMCLEAVKQNINSVVHVKDMTDKIYKSFINHSPIFIQYIENPSIEFIIEQAKKDKRVLNLIDWDKIELEEVKRYKYDRFELLEI